MTSPRIFTRTAPRCLLLGIWLVLSCTPLHAIVGGAGIDSEAERSPWSGVGAVDTGQGLFSGALISPRHVLTAAHVVKGRPVADLAFRLGAQADQGPRLAAKAVHIYPGFRGAKRGPAGVWFDDLAIVELDEAAPAGTAVYGLYTDFALLKSMVAFAGYGGSGSGDQGVQATAKPHVRRVGYNRIDSLVRHSDGSGRPAVFLFDFDGPDFSSNAFKPDQPINASLGADMEATFAGGDSGAPVFVFDQGAWKIVGVAAFVITRDQQKGLYGSIGGGMLVPAHLDWIRNILQAAPP